MVDLVVMQEIPDLVEMVEQEVMQEVEDLAATAAVGPLVVFLL